MTDMLTGLRLMPQSLHGRIGVWERQPAVCFYDFFHEAWFVKPSFGDSWFILEA